MKLIEEIGNRYGRLTVIERVENSKCGQARFACDCDCGGSTVAEGGNLRRGVSQSCGCLSRELSAARKTTHGKTGTSEYISWRSIWARCTNPKHIGFSRYGGRGLAICDKWQTFEGFYEDMGERPSDTHSLDRIDNALGYSKENCRWATSTQQIQNRSNTKWVTYNNQTKTIAEWAELAGIKYITLHNRLSMGWDVQRAITTPVRARKAA
jgi:hypothetical protein